MRHLQLYNGFILCVIFFAVLPASPLLIDLFYRLFFNLLLFFNPVVMLLIINLINIIVRQQFVNWVSTSMPIYPDAHMYTTCTENNGVVFCCSTCDSCGQYVGAFRRPPTNHVLIVSLVFSRPDFGNATLSGLLDYLFLRLQSVINASARSIFNLRWSDHVMPTLVELHWLITG